MKTPTRIAVEVLGPGFLGTVFFFVWKNKEFATTSGFSLRVFAVYLVVAYAFTILPSLGYAFIMERWLKRRSVGSGAIGTIGVSTLVGLIAGFVVRLASEAPVTVIGALVGLVLGGILALSAPDEHRA
jgi:hypothetical protein